MNSGMRQGLYIIFVPLLAAASYFIHLTPFEFLVVCCMAMFVIKLTDIEEAIRR